MERRAATGSTQLAAELIGPAAVIHHLRPVLRGSPALISNDNSGRHTAEQGGRRIANQVPADSTATGVVLKEGGGTYPW